MSLQRPKQPMAGICGCCEGIHPLTPASVANPPGLSAIGYRVGTYSKFRETMIARIPGFPALQGLKTRSDDDLSIALIDSWAAVADVLTFYQERIANEGFLNTAVERRSILELGRELGYELMPGVAASTYLSFTLEDAPGAVTKSTIPIGTKAQSLPNQGQTPPQTPQVFETIEQIDAYPQLNNLKPLAVAPQFTDQTDFDTLPSIVFVGTSTGLKTGDKLMLTNVMSDGTLEPFALKTVSQVTADAAAQQTTVKLWDDPGHFNDPSTALFLGANAFSVASGPSAMESVAGVAQVTTDEIAFAADLMAQGFSYSQIYTAVLQKGWDAGGFIDVLNTIGGTKQSVSRVVVYAFRVRAGLFGSAAQPWNTLPAAMTTEGGPYPDDWEGVAINTTSQGDPYDGGNVVYLDNVYPAVLASDDTPGGTTSWVALLGGDRSCAFKITKVMSRSMADFMMSGKATGLTLDTGTPSPSAFVMPSTVSKNVDFFVTGGGFTPGSALSISINGSVVANREADIFGCFLVVVAGQPANNYQVVVTDEDGVSAPPAALTVISADGTDNPWQVDAGSQITLNPDSGAPGTEFQVLAGAGVFSTNDTVTLTLDGGSSQQVTCGSDGSFSALMQIPASFPVGHHFVLAEGATTPYPQVVDFRVLGGLPQFKLRETTAYAASEQLALATVADTSPVQGDTVKLDRLVDNLEAGQAVAVTGEAQIGAQSGGQGDDQSGIKTSEVAVIKKVSIEQSATGASVTKVQFEESLSNVYIRGTVTINANVALATHGETKSEVLGSGDPSQAYLQFMLKQSPLTFVPAATQSGAKSTLKVSVGGVGWSEVASLYGVGPKDDSYVTRIQNDGTVDVMFGNSRPAVGSENITAKYRVGIGTKGMVDAGQISILMSRPLGVKSVINPTAPTGAQDPEQVDDGRRNVPLKVLTLDRLVSLDDFANFALTFAGIGKALAVSETKGARRLVRLVIGSATGAQVAETDQVYQSLVGAIERYADPMISFVVSSFRRKPFTVGGWIIVDDNHDPNLVLQAVTQALQDAYSYGSMQFGEAVTKSGVVKRMQEVDGVVAADAVDLHLSADTNPVPTDTLFADYADLLLVDRSDPQSLQIEVKTS